MSIETHSDDVQAIRGIADAIRKLHRSIYLDESRISKRFGLTGPQNGVLRALHRRGPMSSAHLSRELFMTASNITGIIDRLEQKGLVFRKRKPEDRRITMIDLTSEGRRLSPGLLDPVEELLLERLAGRDPAEIHRIDHALRRLATLIRPGANDSADESESAGDATRPEQGPAV